MVMIADEPSRGPAVPGWTPGSEAAAVARTVFGAAAEAYDAGRPGYHEALVGEVLTYAGGQTRAAVEVSTYRLLPENRRNRVPAETGDLLNQHGGGITMLHVTDLFLARHPQASQPGRISPASYA
jgi:hypothetical protein